MRLSIRWKLILSIGLPLTVIYAALLIVSYTKITDFARHRLDTYALNMAQRYAARFDGAFSTVAQVARSTAAELTRHPNPTTDELYAMLESNLEQHPLIYGSCIAFEPGAFDPATPLFAPYVHRGDTGVQRIDIGRDAYDYRQWPWYAQPKAAGQPVWTEPYYDQGAGNALMCTFAVPFFTGGKMHGVATIDVSIDALQPYLADFDLEEGGFAILSRQGVFITHPNPKLVMVSAFALAQKANRPDAMELARRMTAGELGVARVSAMDGPTPFTERGDQLLFFAPIASTGWSFGAAVPQSVATRPVRGQLWRSIAMMSGGLALIVGILLVAAVRITRPIEELEAVVQQLAAGNLDVPPAKVRSRDEIGDFAAAFNCMLADLKTHVEALTQETAARQAVESELQVARRIQQSLLPRSFPPFPERSEFDLHAVNLPARQVAGDFFDFFFNEDGRLIFTIADVSGKGVPAALFMAVTRTVLRNLAMQSLSPAEILNRANEVLVQDNEGGMFVTMFLGEYEPATGQLRYANAGHPLPYRLGPPTGDGANDEPDHGGAAVATLGEVTGTLLGVFTADEVEPFQQQQVQLAAGESIVLFTDGIPEARSPQGQFFRLQRLEQLLAAQGAAPPSRLCDLIVQAIEAFEQGDRSDDVTVLTLRRTV